MPARALEPELAMPVSTAATAASRVVDRHSGVRCLNATVYRPVSHLPWLRQPVWPARTPQPFGAGTRSLNHLCGRESR